jgi:hypothetical protein
MCTDNGQKLVPNFPNFFTAKKEVIKTDIETGFEEFLENIQIINFSRSKIDILN